MIDPFMHYILDADNNPIPEPDFIKAAQWFETADRRVGRTRFMLGNQEIEVSTVFLSTPHVNIHLGNDDMMLYETMVFADDAIIQRIAELSESDDRSIIAQFTDDIDIQVRYETRDEAVTGHKRISTFIDTIIGSGQLQPIDEAVQP